MSLIARVRSWLRVITRRGDFEREMQDEMRIHLELYEADLRRRGVPADEARRRALAEFGSVAARKDECRDAVGFRLLGELRDDANYALRLLRRSPAFTLIAVLSLGLGIGANTALFTLIDTVLISIRDSVQGSEKDLGVSINQVTDGYFETTGVRLLTGRSFTPSDRSGSLRVAILNEPAAQAYFPDENPLGRKVNFPGQRVEDAFEIVGVVADTRYKDLRTPDGRMAYVPLEQAIDPITRVAIAVRGPGDVTRLAPSIRAIVTETVPGGFVAGVTTMEQNVEMSLVRERMLALLSTFFAALALILACMGLYGVMAYRVARRTREIGIRIAIGARQQSVVWMMARETLLLVSVGAMVGTLAALAANRYIASQLFGVTPRDPVAIVAALSVLAVVTIAAGYVPARRASRIDPVRALRAE